MTTRYFALVFGAVYALVGVAGFIPAFLAPPQPDAPPLAVDALFGRLIDLFAVNLLHSAFHLVWGVGGIWAYRSFAGSRTYARATTVVFALLAVMGLIPGLDTTFGLIPLYGNDVWLHAATAAIAAYFGFVATEQDERTVGA